MSERDIYDNFILVQTRYDIFALCIGIKELAQVYRTNEVCYEHGSLLVIIVVPRESLDS